jgi:hypothetical protein
MAKGVRRAAVVVAPILAAIFLAAVGAASRPDEPPQQVPRVLPDGIPSRLIFDNFNIYAVDNGPTVDAAFTVNEPFVITWIRTYHWNDGHGERPGLIALGSSDGTIYGPWQARGVDGQGGVRNANWDVEPGVVIPPGTYKIGDSDKTTRSTNAGSGGAGFAQVRGYPYADLERYERSNRRPPPPRGAVPAVPVEPAGSGTAPGETLTPVLTRRLSPSPNPQVVNAGPVTVTVPGGLLAAPAELAISGIGKPPAPPTSADRSLGSFAVSIGALHQLAKPIKIAISVDRARLRKDCPPSAALTAGYYDAAAREWVELPTEYHAETGELVLETPHLSWFDWWYVDKWNYFILPGGTCGVFYDPEVVAAVTGKTNYKAVRPVTNPYVPGYVGDLGAFAGEALAKYAAHQLLPLERPVRILLAGAGNPEYGWGRRRVYMPSKIEDATTLQYAAAHELFHAVQHSEYSIDQIVKYPIAALRTSHLWWIEASAEYASSRLAIDAYPKMGKMDESPVLPRYLTLPLNAFGLTSDEALWRFHQYETAYFLEYICRLKSPQRPNDYFVEMYKRVAAYNGSDAETGLDLFLKFKGEAGGLDSLYRQYVLYYLFSTHSPMCRTIGRPKGPREAVTDDGVNPEATEGARVLTSDGADTVDFPFALDGHHTAKVFAAVPAPSGEKREVTRQFGIAGSTLPARTAVYLCKTPVGRREPMQVLATFNGPADASKLVTLTMHETETLYIVAVNDSPDSATIRVQAIPISAQGGWRYGGIQVEMAGPAQTVWGDGRRESDEYGAALDVKEQVVEWNAARRTVRVAGTVDPPTGGTTTFVLTGTIAANETSLVATVSLTTTASRTERSTNADVVYVIRGTQTINANNVTIPRTYVAEFGLHGVGREVVFSASVQPAAIAATHTSSRTATTSEGRAMPGASCSKTGQGARTCRITLRLTEKKERS